jgi:molybdate-binding protein/DNA-binding XRE family transcriptional regulator
MGVSRLCNRLRAVRLEVGLAQRELAQRVGVSRQTLTSLEAAETVPATSLALALARGLGRRVEDLFWLGEDDRPLEVVLAGAERGTTRGRRVAMATVGERWVAHRLDGEGALAVPADGVLTRVDGKGASRVRPLRDEQLLRQNLVAAGCDPGLGLLAGYLAEGSAGRLHWVEAGSTAALEMLARREVHLAGLHLFDEESGDFNVAAVRRRFPGRAMIVLNLAVWELGLVVAPGNPKRLRQVGDLARRGVRVVGRETGTGAQDLFNRLARAQGISRRAIRVSAVARGHAAVAAAVAGSAADAGIATRAAAVSRDLDFVPLAEARFDLALGADTLQDRRLQRLCDTLASARFRRDLGSLSGYGTARTGNVIAELA